MTNILHARSGLHFTIAALLIAASVTSAEPLDDALPGKVLVAKAIGKVEATHPKNKSPKLLKARDRLTEKHTVNVGPSSSATLAFSNGSIISLLENSSLEISKFLQDPFSTPLSMAMAEEEPSVSTTELNLKNSEVICNAKKLRIDEGSSYSINTPVGAAGIRGTIFAVSYLPDANGKNNGVYTLSVTEGQVAFTDKDGNVTIVNEGEELVITFKLTIDPVTGAIIEIEILSQEIRAIPANRLAMINRVATEGEEDVRAIVFNPTDLIFFANFQTIDLTPAIANTSPAVTEVDPKANGFSD
ncbi:MAG: FecR domain-containing protein [Akkermansiaceae bacterium]